MTALTWDRSGTRYYETGVDHGVLYPMHNGAYTIGVPWNGLTAVNENPTGAEANPMYADNIKYLNLMSAEEFEATIEAYTYPDEFEECDGSREIADGVHAGQQKRKPFGMVYRTRVGNDTEGTDLGYKLHIIYGALASPSEKNYETINDDPDAINFSWDITTTPVELTGYSPTATLVIDSRKIASSSLAALEAILFGSPSADPRLPLPNEIVEIVGQAIPDTENLHIAASRVPADRVSDTNLKANQGKVSVVQNANMVTITENSALSSIEIDGATHKYVALDINTELDSIIGVSIDGTALTSSDVSKATANGLSAGHVFYLVACDTITTSKAVLIEKTGYTPYALVINFVAHQA